MSYNVYSAQYQYILQSQYMVTLDRIIATVIPPCTPLTRRAQQTGRGLHRPLPGRPYAAARVEARTAQKMGHEAAQEQGGSRICTRARYVTRLHKS